MGLKGDAVALSRVAVPVECIARHSIFPDAGDMIRVMCKAL
jgi:hypothetical protein